ncbi:MAG: epoxyqueuosine reductase [Paracoccaceae bacterium]|jgi:epoxyqueuosine reductase
MAKPHDDYAPLPKFLEAFPDVSGNAVNGRGETKPRLASPFFWHPHSKQSFGELQDAVLDHHRLSAGVRATYSPKAPRGPKAVEQVPQKIEKDATAWTAEIKKFALENEADMVGIVPLKPEYVYEGYEIKQPWIVMIGVAMDHERLNSAPDSLDEPTSAVEVGEQYNRAARVSRNLTNYIMEQGHYAKAYAGPYASALLMIPPAIAAGFGELGKHGSLINRQYGSSFRLSAIATEMPLLADAPDVFGADDFCASCQVCTKACPPGAISETKQTVRGVEKWYVDFDKCIPYFGEALGCGICIGRCPWSRPGTAPRLAEKMLARRARLAEEG